jgi:hypothetical protein
LFLLADFVVGGKIGRIQTKESRLLLVAVEVWMKEMRVGGSHALPICVTSSLGNVARRVFDAIYPFVSKSSFRAPRVAPFDGTTVSNFTR